MSLPALIEILPLTQPVRAEVTVPGSKSITNRALILAALADGEVTLTGALWSEDTQIMVECLQKLGFEIRVENDPDEFCNRTVTVKGLGGKIPNGDTTEKPLELFVGNAGTAARFLAAFVCLGNGVYRLSGVPRMHERPQAALFQALCELGYRVESENGNDKLPVRIFGEVGSALCADRTPQRGVPTKKCKVSIEESSQFASALLLCAKVGEWEIEVVGENAEESPYVAMTSKLIEAFPHRGGKFQIEPDASSGSYFWAASATAPGLKEIKVDANRNILIISDSAILVRFWPNSKLQIDENFPAFLLPPTPPLKPEDVLFPPGGGIESLKNDLSLTAGSLKELEELEKTWLSRLLQQLNNPTSWLSHWSKISRVEDAGDGLMTAITIAPLESKPREFRSLQRLRMQETERVFALRTELTKCGAKVVEEGDTLMVYPSQLHGAEIETYKDHRMAMCFAILGLKVPGIKIKDPACVKKTFPNFFQKLNAKPPKGLGAEIWEIKNGQRTRKLEGEDLFAD